MSLDFGWTSLVIAAVVGAVLVDADVIATGTRFSGADIPRHVAALVIGVVIGFLFELLRANVRLLREQTSLSQALYKDAETLAQKLKYQDRALEMLLRSPKHAQVLTTLLTLSLGERFRVIPDVYKNTYLEILDEAIAYSDRFEGVQRKSVSWFLHEGEGGQEYLETLSARPMSTKTRIFVVAGEDLERMKNDLRDTETMGSYWKLTGDVATYWITADKFEELLPDVGLPKDFALYDRRLLIKYDQSRQRLVFDVVGSDCVETKIFNRLDEQLKFKSPDPFRRIERDALVVPSPL